MVERFSLKNVVACEIREHDAALAIRLRRAFNDALARADLDAVLFISTDSAVIVGRKAQLLAWRRESAAVDRTVYVRTPETIVASPVEPIALEYGRWRGGAASGNYTAKWREVAGEWVIEAEIYVTLA